MKTNETTYQTRIVAFLDILGFKEIVKQSEINPTKVDSIYEALRFLKTWEDKHSWTSQLVEIEESAQKKGLKDFDISSKTNCTCFSDSIAVSVIVDDGMINQIASTFISNLIKLGAKLIVDGILLRGGLTIGNLLHTTDGIILGQALIEAYELENRSAKYPRVIISNKLLNKLNYPLETKTNKFPYHSYVKRFNDGCVGFHQLQYFDIVDLSDVEDSKTLTDKLKRAKEVIINGLDSSFEHPDVHEKI